MSWERAFVVATVTLGDSFDDALGALDPAPRARVQGAVVAMRAKSRPERATWMAAVLQEVAVEIERMGIG